MGIQFLLGVDHEKKHDYLLQMIRKKLEKDRNDSIIYIVPDNVKFEAEVMLLDALRNDSDTAGMIDVQVYSFSRLAWLLNTGEVENKIRLTGTGLGMLISKILHENRSKLTIFQKEINNPGFIEQLVNLFSEFRGGQLSANTLYEIASEEKKFTYEFEQKLKELSIIYSKFEEEIGESYRLNEDLLIQLQKDIANANLQDTTIIIDRYDYFTANELKVVEAFGKHTKNVLINLSIANSPYRLKKEEKLFFNQGIETYYKIESLAKNHSIPLMEDIICTGHGNRHIALNHLNNWWYESSTRWSTAKPSSEILESSPDALRIYQYNNKKTEVFHTATKIKQIVARDNLRYNDFLILSRDMDGYQLVIEQVFQDIGLPYFINHTQSMIHHPLFEFLESLFKIIKFNYRHEDVMRLLKTELIVPLLNEEDINYIKHLEDDTVDTLSRDKNFEAWKNSVKEWRSIIDVTENVVLALGYDRNDWLDDEEWIYARFDMEDLTNQIDHEKYIQERANLLKVKFQQIIVPFQSELSEVSTYTELIHFLYEWMLQIGVRDQLLFWRDQMIAEDRLEEANQHEQAWDALMEVFDEWVELLGDEEWDLDLFLTIIESGFEQKKYQSIPPKIDQVLIDNYNHRSLTSKKIVFILGMNNQLIPMFPTNNTLLTDEDREILKTELPSEVYIRNSSLDRSLDEPFRFLEAISQATDQLFLSFASSDIDNNDLKMSPYLERIVNAYHLPVEFETRFSDADETLKEQQKYVSTDVSAIEFYLYNKIHNQDLKDSLVSSFWEILTKNLINQSDTDNKTKRKNNILKSEKYRNQISNLPIDLAQQLYLPTDESGSILQPDLYLSVSQIESFFADPYGHYLRYGLRLQDRPILELSPLERGNFFHDMLDRFIKELIANEIDFSTLSDKQLNDLVDQIFNTMMGERTYRVLTKTPIMKFNGDLLKRTIKQFIESMRFQVNHSLMHPKYSEVLFGRLGGERGLPALSLPLDHGGQIKVRGKIDRIDYYANPEKKTGYYNVVDYKSSDQTLDFKKILLGTQLQLITYLNVVEKNAEQLFNDGFDHQKLGMYYSYVHFPLIDLSMVGNHAIIDEVNRALRLKGINIEDTDIFKEIFNDDLASLNNVVNIRVTGSGSFHGQDKKTKVLMNDTEFDPFLRYSEQLIQKAGNDILSGETRLVPLIGSGIHAPSLNEYQGISQFDPALPFNQSLKIDDLKINKDNVLKEIMEQLQEGRVKDAKDYFN